MRVLKYFSSLFVFYIKTSTLSCSKDVDGLITQALLTGNFEGAVELCLHDNRMADSIILAIAGGPQLLEETQKKYFTRTHSKITKVTAEEASLRGFLILVNLWSLT